MASTGRPAAPPPVVDEEQEELLRNFGEHAAMQKVQAALKKQLTDNLARTEAELRAQEESREAARAMRESVGVELYGIQQQLARLQTDLEAKAREASSLQAGRGSAEAELSRYEEAARARDADIAAKEGALEKAKGELDGLADTIRAVEKYNADMSAEIALTKRATHKAEEDVVAKEKSKAAQDTYIEKLTTSVMRAAEELALLQAQRDAQRAQREAAIASMGDAAGDMDAVQFEKQQLVQLWQSSVVAMRRRDEMVVSQNKAIDDARNELDGMGAEEGNVRKATAAVQGDHAKLQDALDRERADLAFLETSVATLERQYNALSEREASLGAALGATDAEIKRCGVELNRLNIELKAAERERYVLDQRRFGIENEIAAELGGKLTNEVAARSLVKEVHALTERMHALEMTKAETENAIAAARVQSLNASARVGALRDALTSVEKDLLDKQRLIERTEVEVKARTDGIEKRMTTVDRLNRAWEKLVGGQPEAENMGPLHAEVSNLLKNIGTVRASCDTLQRRWLADQSQLVSITNEVEVKGTRQRETSSQAVVLNQKRVRLDAELASQRGELKALEAGIHSMHADMGRINALIAKNAGLAQRLELSTIAAEREFTEELRDAERDCAATDSRIQALEVERARLLEELVEAERQVVLWEKKIALEKETQEALDPSVGVSETAGMEKEIVRMRARFEALKRDQERLSSEMERAIAKREVIAMKHKSARAVTMAAASAVGKGSVAASGGSMRGSSSAGGGKASEGDALTRIGLQQRAEALRREIEAKRAAAEDMGATLQGTLAESVAITGAASSAAAQVEELEARAAALQAAVSASLFEKQKAAEAAGALAKLHQRFDAFDAGKLPALTAEEASHVRTRLAEAEGHRDSVREIVAALGSAAPELVGVLDRVAQLCDAAPTLD